MRCTLGQSPATPARPRRRPRGPSERGATAPRLVSAAVAAPRRVPHGEGAVARTRPPPTCSWQRIGASAAALGGCWPLAGRSAVRWAGNGGRRGSHTCSHFVSPVGRPGQSCALAGQLEFAAAQAAAAGPQQSRAEKNNNNNKENDSALAKPSHRPQMDTTTAAATTRGRALESAPNQSRAALANGHSTTTTMTTERRRFRVWVGPSALPGSTGPASPDWPGDRAGTRICFNFSPKSKCAYI